MTEQTNLVERLKKYDSYLVGKIEEEKRIGSEESLLGSIAADQRTSAYQSAQERLYQIFPEIKTN